MHFSMAYEENDSCLSRVSTGLEEAMKVYICSSDENSYLDTNGKWVHERSGACDFKSSIRALDHYRNSRLSGAKIMISFGCPERDISFTPSNDSWLVGSDRGEPTPSSSRQG
jgi:hypothetical protein